MSLIVGIRFADLGKMYYFDPEDLALETGDFVIVETARGTEIGEVVLAPREIEDTSIVSPIKKVLKKAEEKDLKRRQGHREKEENALRVCEDRIRKRNMPMKLIDAEYAFDGSKIIFYFAAEGRVDFRELVKDLASVFKTRIELRQIGVRDEAKKIGGLGPCGRAACCNTFLVDFAPVSIKMAKEQNLSLSPTKISGLCGRLMCCLHYEHEHYHEMRKKLPRVGSLVETPDGIAEVCDTNPIRETVKGRLALPDGSFDIRTYPLEETKRYMGRKEDVFPRPERRAPVKTEEETVAEDADGARKEHTGRDQRTMRGSKRRTDSSAHHDMDVKSVEDRRRQRPRRRPTDKNDMENDQQRPAGAT